MGNCLGSCWSQESLEKQVVYTPLGHTPHALSVISEASHETEGPIEPPPLHI